MQASFGRDIGVNCGPAQYGCDGACVDDTTKFVGQHQASCIAGEAEASRKIYVNHPIEIIIFPFDEWAAMLNAGIVDQNIQMAKAFGDIFEGGSGGGTIRYIEGHSFCANFCCGFGQSRGITRVDDHVRAIFLQRLCHGKTQPTGSSGNECHATFERKHMSHSELQKNKGERNALPPSRV